MSVRKKVVQGPEQKSEEWITDLVSKICEAEELVLDICAGILETVKKC